MDDGLLWDTIRHQPANVEDFHAVMGHGGGRTAGSRVRAPVWSMAPVYA